MDKIQIYGWFEWFIECRMSFEDSERSGRPSSGRNGENKAVSTKKFLKFVNRPSVII